MTDIVERLRGVRPIRTRLGRVLYEWSPVEAAAEVERLQSIIRDLLWAIGHDDERALNDVTARARAALEPA